LEVASLTKTPVTVPKLVGPDDSLRLIVPALAVDELPVVIPPPAALEAATNVTVYVADWLATSGDTESCGPTTGAPMLMLPVDSVGPWDVPCIQVDVVASKEPLNGRTFTTTEDPPLLGFMDTLVMFTDWALLMAGLTQRST
jgi:hypothetical protein